MFTKNILNREVGLAVGVVAPFDMELDRELWRWTPNDVDLLVSRTPVVGSEVTVEFAQNLTLGGGLAQAVETVTRGRAESVAYACTSASFIGGKSREADLVAGMKEAGASAAVTTSGALVKALNFLGASRVSIVNPYTPDISEFLASFFSEFGIETLSNYSLGATNKIWEIPYREVAQLVLEANVPESEAVVISCTNLPTYDIIHPLEEELGKPVISANQATMWALLETVGRSAVGEGQILLRDGHI